MPTQTQISYKGKLIHPSVFRQKVDLTGFNLSKAKKTTLLTILESNNIDTIDELVEKTPKELRKIKGIGSSTISNIQRYLQTLNLELGMKLTEEIYNLVYPKEETKSIIKGVTKYTDNGDGTTTLSPADPDFGKIIIPQKEFKQTVQEYEQQGLEKHSYELKDTPKQETLEEAAYEYSKTVPDAWSIDDFCEEAFKEGAKWQEKRMYSKEDMRECWKAAYEESFNKWIKGKPKKTFRKWFKQYKKKSDE